MSLQNTNLYLSLSDTLRLYDLKNILCVSKYKAYSMLQNRELPYLKIGHTIVFFKQNIIELLNKVPFSYVEQLNFLKNIPEAFSPAYLAGLLSISKSNAYKIVQTETR